MAGVTTEVRMAAERLPDRISLGVLEKTFPPGLLDEVIEEAGTRERRRRSLPARLTMLLVLACWLFTRSGYGIVLSRLADAHAVDVLGWGSWRPAGTGSIAKARARLGPTALRLLFGRVAGPSGTTDTPGVFWRGLRVCAVDGFTLDVHDTPANSEHFGRGGNGSGSANPYPQLRALVVAEAGTRSLIAAAHGPSTTGEQTLAVELLPSLAPGMLLLADRNFASWQLWTRTAATGVDLCWRMSASFTLPVIEVLPDGTYLSELRAPRGSGGAPVTVRVVEYSVTTSNHGDGDGATSELFALATTLLDPDTAPADELAVLYHDRWQVETAIADLKTVERGGPEVVLRSKSPDMVTQEFWAFLCVYQAVRELISYAAPPGLDPARISFKRTLEAARDSVSTAALSPRGG